MDVLKLMDVRGSYRLIFYLNWKREKMLTLFAFFIFTVETSFKDQDSTIFTDVSSTQEGDLPLIEKTSKSLKECSECKKSFK